MIMGAIAENLVASDLLHRGHEQGFQYWLGRKEIDFILPDFVEVKYQKHVSVNEFEWLNKIIPANKNIVILTQTDKASNDRIHLIPLREWLCR
jgi:predicted AAA+ superfamily ATPase